MDAVPPQDEAALRSELGRARERLESLVGDLRAIDRELEGLLADRERYRLLGEVCDRLDELSARGAGGLFWGEGSGDRDQHVRVARGRVDAFEKHFQEIEERRQALLERVVAEQQGTAWLEEDLLEWQREAEERAHEWPIEREISAVPGGALVMPWTRGGEDDSRFRKSLGTSLLVSLAFALIVPFVDLPLPERLPPAAELPERLTRLLPDPRPLVRERKPEQAAPPRVAKRAPTKPVPVEPAPAEAAPGPASAPQPAGLLAFREQLARVAGVDVTLGAQARIRSAGDTASGRPVRSMLTTRAPGASGGINLAALSRGVGSGTGSGLGGVEVARVASAIGGVGQGGGARAAGGTGAGSGVGQTAGRTDEEIQIVFDRHKSELYRLYNRELRNDPTLEGQIVLRMRIEPNGSVSLCALQATDMDAPQLASQVVERVRGFDFGAKEGIAAVTILYPIEFLPAT